MFSNSRIIYSTSNRAKSINQPQTKVDGRNSKQSDCKDFFNVFFESFIHTQGMLITFTHPS